MSTRTSVYAVSDLTALMRVIGSNDAGMGEAILSRYRARYGEDGPEAEAEFVAGTNSLLAGQLEGSKEPSDWPLVVEFLAEHLGMTEGGAVLEDWESMAWLEYHDEVKRKLSKPTRPLLKWLVDGRPLTPGAKGIHNNGAFYAWLAPDEVASLKEAIEEMSDEWPECEEVADGFNEELLNCLDSCEGKWLLLLAS